MALRVDDNILFLGIPFCLVFSDKRDKFIATLEHIRSKDKEFASSALDEIFWDHEHFSDRLDIFPIDYFETILSDHCSDL